MRPVQFGTRYPVIKAPPQTGKATPGHAAPDANAYQDVDDYQEILDAFGNYTVSPWVKSFHGKDHDREVRETLKAASPRLPRGIYVRYGTEPYQHHPFDLEYRERDVAYISPLDAPAVRIVRNNPTPRRLWRGILELFPGIPQKMKWEPIPQFVDRIVAEAHRIAQEKAERKAQQALKAEPKKQEKHHNVRSQRPSPKKRAIAATG